MYSNDELQALLPELSKNVTVGVHDVHHLSDDRSGAVGIKISVYMTLDPSEYSWGRTRNHSPRWKIRRKRGRWSLYFDGKMVAQYRAWAKCLEHMNKAVAKFGGDFS